MTIDPNGRPGLALRGRATRPVKRRLGGLVFLGLVALAACGGGAEESLDERRQEVAERGKDVMPFDLDATTHRFDPVDEGLVQTVTADDPDDQEQIELIRGHLKSEAARFSAGDYADPASIHGEDMPGLAELEAGARKIAVTYEPIDVGGRIDFVTEDPDLVDALDRWAEAQTMDHGTHAESGT